MYINEKEKAVPTTVEGIKAKLIELAQNALKNGYLTKREKDDLKLGISDTDEGKHLLNHFASQLHGLNEAMLKDRSVWAECVKEPRNLDSGRHYFAVYYVTENGQRDRIWARGFAGLCGQDIQDRDRNIDRYVFSSGAIGMSRQLDATDGLFNLLKKVGGLYAQL